MIRSEIQHLSRKNVIILVPGPSEREVIPKMLNILGIKIKRPRIITNISYKNGEVVIARKVFSHLRAALESNPDKIIVVFDRENAEICPGDFARLVTDKCKREISQLNNNNFSVVCANHKLENWVLADISVFNCRLFANRRVSTYVQDRSDCKDAIEIIKLGFGTNQAFNKVTHLPRLVDHIKFENDDFRRRSPSLDKFLREMGI